VALAVSLSEQVVVCPHEDASLKLWSNTSTWGGQVSHLFIM